MTAHAGASTDMGNVSCEIPSIHHVSGTTPFLGKPSTEFAARCVTASADKAVRDGHYNGLDSGGHAWTRRFGTTAHLSPESVSDRRSQPENIL